MTRLTIHTNRSLKRSIHKSHKALFKPVKFENALTPTFRFRVVGKYFDNGVFENVFKFRRRFTDGA